jgi:PKD repeat protein
VITAGQTLTGKVGVGFSRTPASTGTINSWSATGLPSGLSINSSTGLISGTPLRKGNTTVTLTATGTGGTSSVTATISIEVGVPVIQSGQTLTGKVGELFSSVLLLTDPDDRPVTSWLLEGPLQSGLSFNSTTGIISGTPYSWGVPGPPPFQNFQGPSNVYMTLTGPGGAGPKTAFDLVINFGKPDIVKGQVFSSVAGLSFDVLPQVNNRQNRPVNSWSATGLPSWATFDATTGRIYGSTYLQDAARTTITLTATGEGGTDSTTAEIFIAAGAPVITANQSFSGKVDQAFSATPALTDSTNRPAYSWTAVDLPAGLSINTSTGAIKGTPSKYGSFTTLLTATGEVGQASEKTPVNFEIAPEIPIIAPNQVFSGQVGVGLSAYVSLVNAEGRPVHAPIYRPPTDTDTGGYLYLNTWDATGLPEGFTIYETGQISGPAAQSGNFTITLKAYGPAGESAPVTATIQIAVGVPIIVSGQSFTGKVGESFSATPALSDAVDRPATSWAITSGTLPSGLTLNTTTGAITGTPSAKVIRTVSLRASGGGGTGPITSVTFTISDGAPSITPGQVFTGPLGVAFSGTPALTNSANRPATSWSATALPAGLSINSSTGQITGTPTVKGSSTATITATGPGGTGTQSISFSIAAAFLPPVITPGQSASGTVGQAFSFTPASSGTITSWSASNLPAGLLINTSSGQITGTPTTDGSYSTSITATNLGGSDTKTLAFTIAAAIPIFAGAVRATAIYAGAVAAKALYYGAKKLWPPPQHHEILESLATINPADGSRGYSKFLDTGLNLAASNLARIGFKFGGAVRIKNATITTPAGTYTLGVATNWALVKYFTTHDLTITTDGIGRSGSGNIGGGWEHDVCGFWVDIPASSLTSADKITVDYEYIGAYAAKHGVAFWNATTTAGGAVESYIGTWDNTPHALFPTTVQLPRIVVTNQSSLISNTLCRRRVIIRNNP